MKAKDVKKEIKAQTKNASKEQYKRSTDDEAAHKILEDRKLFLKEYRKPFEEIWKSADIAYVPHRVTKSVSKKTLVSDDELGWRSKPINLQADDEWQEDSVPPNPYIKIQTAMGIIVDRNPSAVMSPAAKKYMNNTVLMKNLYEASWDIAGSRKAMLKPFVFNCSKYGIGIGRTFPLTIKRDVRNLDEYHPEDTKKNKYTESSQVYFSDVFRESLSPWQVWLDDGGIVGNFFSFNDVIFYKDYEWHKLKSQFGHLQNFPSVKPVLKILTDEHELVSSDSYAGTAKKNAKLQERVWFYENLELDLFVVETEDGVVLVNEPMPQTPKNKRLSVYSSPWTMRDDKTPYGIGVYEAMRSDQKMYTKYRNMTMDQVVLSIYKEFFYTGTETLEGDGQMVTRPGKGRQVSDAKNIKWNEIPGPGEDAWKSLDYMMARIDDVTGISKSLQGEITGSTAFEISQARESALKRMKIPLEHITDALESEAYISCGLIEDIYSVAKIKLLSDDRYIEPFEIDQYETQDGEQLMEGRDYEKEYKEPQLNLQRDEKTGELKKSQTKSFFKLKPDDFPWEGVIKIVGQSIIANSELLDRTTTVELMNIVVPLFAGPREIGEKPAREIVKAYNKDPEDILPDAWLQPAQPKAGPELFTSANSGGAPAEEGKTEMVDMSAGVGSKIPAARNLANSVRTMGQR